MGHYKYFALKEPSSHTHKRCIDNPFSIAAI